MMRFFLKNWSRFYWKWGVRLFPISVVLYVVLFGCFFFQVGTGTPHRGGIPYLEGMFAVTSIIFGVFLAAAPFLQSWNPWGLFAVFSTRPRRKLLRVVWRHCDRPLWGMDVACFALCVVQIGLVALSLQKLAEPSQAPLIFPFFCTLNGWIAFFFCLGFLWKNSTEAFSIVYEKKILPFLVIQGALIAPLSVLLVAVWRGVPWYPLGDVVRFLMDLFCLSIYFTFAPIMALALVFFVKLGGDFAHWMKRKGA